MATGCGLFQGTGRFCTDCGFNRGIHRRWKVIDGGKKGRETMSATSEANETATAEHARLVELVNAAMEAGYQGSLYVGINDPDKWAAMKAKAGYPAVRLAGDRTRICETFSVTVNYFTLHAQGPTWKPTAAEYGRMLDERIG
jgi:hypothetical protein